MASIDRQVPYTGRDGENAYVDLDTLKPGDLLDPASNWNGIIKPIDHRIPISWLFFKGNMLMGPTPGHPFEGPWGKPWNVTFSLDLLSLNSTVTQKVMSTKSIPA
jgi:hypothetical protein